MKISALPQPVALALALFISAPSLPAEVTLDGSFNPSLTGWVLTVAVQPDGQILIGGRVNVDAAVPRTNLARLNIDGTVDGLFHPPLLEGVDSVQVQNDERIMVGFSGAIARLDPDGSRIPGFPETIGYRSPVLEAGGSILVFGGYKRIQRLDRVGNLVALFPVPGWGEDQDVYVVAVQTDGKILAGGEFDVDGILRLNADGSPDLGFSQKWFRQQGVEALCEQADGKILIAGGFVNF